MAAPKRPHHESSAPNISGSLKKPKAEHKDSSCHNFLVWCGENGLTMSEKVCIGKEGSVCGYGMIATKDIALGECLFDIPRTLLLSPSTCGIAKLLQDEASSIKSSSGWMPLLLALMYEYTHDESRWKPYYSLVPVFAELNLPMFSPREDVDEQLMGTGVPEAVVKDVENLENEFYTVAQPFVMKHPKVFSDDRCLDVEFFKKMVAFIMAYSFTEPSEEEDEGEGEGEKKSPMMVPLADILNHVANSNAHLQFYQDSLRMEATQNIKKGQEVFNTYGELSNWQLLQMYGFAEVYPNNIYDTVDIAMPTVLASLTAGKDKEEVEFINTKWNFLQGIDIVTDEGMYVLGGEGILTEEEMYTTLKVMVMDKSTFLEHKEKEGWSETEDNDDDDDEGESLTFGDIPSLPNSWKVLLKQISGDRLKAYPRTLKEEEQVYTKRDSSSHQECVASIVRYGQQKLLTLLIQTCENQ